MKKKLTIGLIIYTILFILGKILLNAFGMEYIAYFYPLSFILEAIIVLVITYLGYKEEKVDKIKGGPVVLIMEYLAEIILIIILYFGLTFVVDLKSEKIILDSSGYYVLRYNYSWPNTAVVEKYKFVTFFIRSKEPIDVEYVNN